MLIPKIKFFPSEDTFPVYRGNDLGVHYSSQKTTFKVWSPFAEGITLNLYKADRESPVVRSEQLIKKDEGTWQLSLEGDFKNTYYTYNINFRGTRLGETPGIYAKASGVNGERGMIVDLEDSNPPEWQNDRGPEIRAIVDIILYELHITDYTVHKSSGAKHPGKYIGLSEEHLQLSDGTSVGFEHIKELGVTHVHLLPVFDFMSIDESKPTSKKYNWGYDPDNYNIPEGSYATDASDGNVRIREFKQLINTFHRHGIGVIMDVVFNHTGPVNDSNFNKEFPNYYYRFTEGNKKHSDGTGCKSETASEKAGMRKYMVDSCSYWTEEYHIDGFRFDLMGVHDITTMNEISAALHNINPNIVLYGEGWAGGACAIDESLRAVKNNTRQLNKIAAFSDDIRDALKGSVFKLHDNGFIGGSAFNAEYLKPCITASVSHPQVSRNLWSPAPGQCVNYVSCHDNFTLYDKIKHSSPHASDEEIRYMHKLALAIVLTSQGIPFLHAGSEFMRSKKGHHNSYNKPHSINQIDWYLKTQNHSVFEYVKELIALRKQHPAFRLRDTESIAKHVLFWDTYNENVLAYQIKDYGGGDKWKNIVVILNGQKKPFKAHLPEGEWYLAADRDKVYQNGVKSINGGEFNVDPVSCTIFFEN